MMRDALSMSVGTEHKDLLTVATAMEHLAREDDWSDDVVFKVNLVVEEVIINIQNHGQQGDEDPDIRLEVRVDDDEIAITISDRGKAFDPLTEAPEPKIDEDVQHRPIGGLGVFLTKQLMDEVRYQREGGRNELYLTARKAS